MAPRVLIVDDFPPFRRLAAKLLSKSRYEVHEAGDGAEALRLVRRQAFDLMLLDLKLGPPLSGAAVLRRLRAEPGTVKLPVIAMSGIAMPEDISEALSAGASDFIAKGENEDVLRSVERVLSSRPAPVADVLHLEDDDEWALLVDRWLGQHGLKVHRVRSRAELRSYLSSGRPLPRCLVADLTLGPEDGFLVCDEIKASPAFQGLPIIVLTAKPVSSVDCLARQALYRVAKGPEAESELRAAVTSVLAQQDRSRGIIDLGDLRVDSRTGVVDHAGRTITLSGGFLSAFVLLVRRSPKAVDDAELYGAFLSRGSYHKLRDPVSICPVVRNYVCLLRKKLSDAVAASIVRLKDGYAYQP